MPKYSTAFGMDVHLRSTTVCALDADTGEAVTRRFPGNPWGEIAGWMDGFPGPSLAAYESGYLGFAPQRELSALGVDCVVAAVSKVPRSAADLSSKNDRNDAEFLARMLSVGNVVEVCVPDDVCEAARDLVRALDDAREDLKRCKQRLSKFLLRHGLVFSETNAKGQRKKNWTAAHWAWIRSISFPDKADDEVLAYYIDAARQAMEDKARLERLVEAEASKPRWKKRVDSVRCLKGIDVASAADLVFEAGEFSRFKNARSFAAWIGLTPSEHSSGESVRQGGITKAGNKHLRRVLVESAWHYLGCSPHSKDLAKGQAPDPDARRHAAKGVRRLVGRRAAMLERGVHKNKANVATARELACWCWAIGRMVENG